MNNLVQALHRRTKHPEFEPTEVQIYDHWIMCGISDDTETLALTTELSRTAEPNSFEAVRSLVGFVATKSQRT